MHNIVYMRRLFISWTPDMRLPSTDFLKRHLIPILQFQESSKMLMPLAQTSYFVLQIRSSLDSPLKYAHYLHICNIYVIECTILGIVTNPSTFIVCHLFLTLSKMLHSSFFTPFRLLAPQDSCYLGPFIHHHCPESTLFIGF